MQIDNVKQFLFYPLHASHTPTQKIVSTIVNIALTCLTAGVYLAVFAAVRLYDHLYQKHPQNKPNGSQEPSHTSNQKGSQRPSDTPAQHNSKIPTFTSEQVACHNTENDCWIILSKKVYDVTQFLQEHPGGIDIIYERAGRDATQQFIDIGHSAIAYKQVEKYFKGNLVEG